MAKTLVQTLKEITKDAAAVQIRKGRTPDADVQ